MHFSTFQFQRAVLTRPLGIISDFVADELPAALEAPSNERLREHLTRLENAITSEFHAACLSLAPKAAKVACLDLGVLAHACGHAQVALPPRLHLLLLTMASRYARLPTMLYEDNVLNNPIDSDPRLFTSGETGECERTFLSMHQRIESAIEGILHRLFMLADLAQRDSIIRECDAGMKDLVKYFKAFNAMPAELFSKFRKYYGTPPNGRHLGVSGRFSESINTLRLLLEGRRIEWAIPNFLNELLENIHYYPSSGRTRLLAAIEHAVTQQDAYIDQFTRADSSVRDMAAQLRRSLDSVTGIHLQLVKKYIL